MEQLHKIFKLCGSPSDDYWKRSRLQNATLFKPHNLYKRCFRETFKDFPVTALSLLDSLLAIEPEHRKTATDALKSEVIFNFLPFSSTASVIFFLYMFLKLVLHLVIRSVFPSIFCIELSVWLNSHIWLKKSPLLVARHKK